MAHANEVDRTTYQHPYTTHKLYVQTRISTITPLATPRTCVMLLLILSACNACSPHALHVSNRLKIASISVRSRHADTTHVMDITHLDTCV